MAFTLIDDILRIPVSQDIIDYDVTTSTNLEDFPLGDPISGPGPQAYPETESVTKCMGTRNCSHDDILLRSFSFSKRHGTLVMSLYIIIQVTGLLLNLTVSRFIMKSRLFHESSSIVLFNLSFVDCLHCILLTIPTVSIATGSWAHSDYACAAYGFLFHCLASVSLNNIAVISIERFLSVVKNQKGPTTRRRWKWVIIGVWVIGVLESLPLLEGWFTISSHSDPLMCSLHWPWGNGSHISYVILYSVFAVALPITIQISCHCKIYARVSSVARRVRYSRMSATAALARQVTGFARSNFSSVAPASFSSQPSSPSSKDTCKKQHGIQRNFSEEVGSCDGNSRRSSKPTRESRHEVRLARTMVLTSLGTYLSWGPYFVAMLVSAARPINSEVAALTAILASLSTIYNPLFYIIMNKGFINSVRRRLPMKDTSPVAETATEDNSHGVIPTVSRSVTDAKTSQPNTTWRSSLRSQNPMNGAAPDGLDTIVELSTPAVSPVFEPKFGKMSVGISNIRHSDNSHKVTQSTQTTRHSRRLTRKILSSRSFTIHVEHSSLPVIEV